MIQLGRFLGRPLGSLLKSGLPFIENVLEPLSKVVLKLLGLTAAPSGKDAAIQKLSVNQPQKHQHFQMKTHTMS